MTIVKGANLALAFALELAALVALGMWASSLGLSSAARWAIGIGAIVVWATVWGVFFSPKASVTLPDAAKQVGQLVMFVVAVVALGASGRWTLAVVFGIVVLINRALLLAVDAYSVL